MAARLCAKSGFRSFRPFSVLQTISSGPKPCLLQSLRLYSTTGPGGSDSGPTDSPSFTSDLSSFKPSEHELDSELGDVDSAESAPLDRAKRREKKPKEPIDVMSDRPTTSAYFTEDIPFTELLTALDLCVSKYTDHIPFYSAKPTPEQLKKPADRYVPWFSLRQMCRHVRFNLTETQYNSLIARLEQLVGDSKEDLHKLPLELQKYLEGFSRTGKLWNELQEPKTLDDMGRAYAHGRRKEAGARVWLVKGEGAIIINGRPLASYFARMVDREQVLLPFELTSTIGKYNAWIQVLGGGTTGQSGAIRLGISQALVIHEPALQTLLAQEGLLTRDTRMVERKKTGRPKARKGFTWVKR